MGEEPTPLEASVARSGFYHFKIRKNAYSGLSTALDNAMSFPNSNTERELRTAEHATEATDGQHYLVAWPAIRVRNVADRQQWDNIGGPSVSRILDTEYAALVPVASEP